MSDDNRLDPHDPRPSETAAERRLIAPASPGVRYEIEARPRSCRSKYFRVIQSVLHALITAGTQAAQVWRNKLERHSPC